MDLRGKTHKESSRGENIHVLRTGEPALIHAWELESLLINKFYNNPDFFNVFFSDYGTSRQSFHLTSSVRSALRNPPLFPVATSEFLLCEGTMMGKAEVFPFHQICVGFNYKCDSLRLGLVLVTQGHCHVVTSSISRHRRNTTSYS